MLGKCPKCDNLINFVNVNEIEIRTGDGASWRGVSYICPYCFAVVGVQMDPISLKADLKNEILSVLQGKKLL